MLDLFKIRGWRRSLLSCLIWLSLRGLALAQTDNSAPAKKPAQTAPASATTKKPANAAHSSTRHAASQASSKTKTLHSKKGLRYAKGSKKRGQQGIDTTRAREIQEALIREHYLQGEPSGTWDANTQAAMQKFQADQGWQSKTTPDSRALIKLGLGPSHDHLLNPESAMTTAPAAAVAKPAAQQPPLETEGPKQ